jgi:glycosyltransferase involved in cell wall biosynthesis
VRDTVVTVGGTIGSDVTAEIQDGRRPRADYDRLAAAFGADVVDVGAAARAGGPGRRMLARVGGGGVLLGWHCFRERKTRRVVFTDTERVGFPFAALSRMTRAATRHVMIAHRITPRKKVLVHRLLGLRRRIDVLVVYSSVQRDFAIEHLGYRPEDVVLTPFMVDASFWREDAVTPNVRSRPLICAVGQELRDYPTLVNAVRGLDVDVVLAAASPWSKRSDTSQEVELPPNVEVRAFHPFDLRQLYADAAFVVVPLQETDFQAGITTILEAMSMSRAVVCTQTRGQIDTVIDGKTGRYVPASDVVALRAAVERLLRDPAEAKRLGTGGRDWVVQHADIDVYARNLGERCGITVRGSVR